MPKRHFRRLPAAGILLFFFMLNAQSARAQDIGGLDTVDRIDTEHFSIYFPAVLEDQARRLSGFADSVLSDLAGLLDTPIPAKRLPVLLSDVSIDLNGSFSTYPSNRIVIYLAGASGSLYSLGDELREVFLHELVHALSLNERGPFWSVLSALAGDSVAPAAWVAPDSLIEGTAVWAESRDGESGRLNDPGALESVYLDLAVGKRRGLWEVSGLADFPGSGNLPYYYGALFAAYVEENYGKGSVARLWAEAAKGDAFSGFDGSLLGGGAIERALGKPGREVWTEFTSWLSAGAEKGARASGDKAKSEILSLDTRRIGPFAAGGGFLYYYDGERKAVFSLSLAGKERKKLFDADAQLEAMRLSEDGKTLLLDWARGESDGKTRALEYGCDLASGKVSLLGPRDPGRAGEALANLSPGAALRLEGAQLPDAAGWTYGLARMGSSLLPVRVGTSGDTFVMDVEGFVVRSLALDRGKSGLIVLSAIPPGGVSRLAVLESRGDSWVLHIQKEAPAGGARDAVISEGEVFYRSSLGEGVYGIGRLQLDDEALAEDFSSLSGSWIPVETWRKGHGGLEAGTKPASGTKPPIKFSTGFLFPELFRSTRYPWADGEAIGLEALGMDLTGRLSWSALAGWDYVNEVPEEALSIGLAAGSQSFGFSASDRAAKSATTSKTVRSSTAVLSHAAAFSFLPDRDSLSFGETLWCAGLDDDYTLAEFGSPDFSYLSVGGRLNLLWSTMGNQTFPPYDLAGFSAKGGADYELIPGQGQGWSAFGSAVLATARPSLSLSLYGVVSPDASLAFLPAGRLLNCGSSSLASALSPPYPVFKEYSGQTSSSPWYFFGEAQVTLLDLELWDKIGPLRLPLLPSVGLRRIVFRGGLRAAAFDAAGGFGLTSPIFPAAAFLRAEGDSALLAGIAGLAHIYLMGEVSYAFASALSGGGAFHYDFGFGVSY